ncbi:MAG: hypothetical protein ACTS3F_08260 [Phycisphaerales bacterium]
MNEPHPNDHDPAPLFNTNAGQRSPRDEADATTPEPARWGKPRTPPTSGPSSRRRTTCGDPPARHDGPETSKAAAAAMREAAPKQRARVFAFIASRGEHGATDDEGERALDLPAQTYTPRRGELVKRGLIAWTGDKRPTERGRLARVWAAVDPMTSADTAPDRPSPTTPPRMAHAPATIGGGA